MRPLCQLKSLTEIRALAAKATPLPFVQTVGNQVYGTVNKDVRRLVAYCCHDEHSNLSEQSANAELLTYAANSLIPLTERVAELETFIRKVSTLRETGSGHIVTGQEPFKGESDFIDRKTSVEDLAQEAKNLIEGKGV